MCGGKKTCSLFKDLSSCEHSSKYQHMANKWIKIHHNYTEFSVTYHIIYQALPPCGCFSISTFEDLPAIVFPVIVKKKKTIHLLLCPFTKERKAAILMITAYLSCIPVYVFEMRMQPFCHSPYTDGRFMKVRSEDLTGR